MHRNFAKVERAGTPVSWLGANFWSRAGGPLMWSRYDASVVREELTVLRDNGLTMTRSFLYWPDVMPAPHQLDEDQLAHFGDLLTLHAEPGPVQRGGRAAPPVRPRVNLGACSGNCTASIPTASAMLAYATKSSKRSAAVAVGARSPVCR